MDNHEEANERKEAMRLFVEGVSPSEICRCFGRSREWFYKWKKRYETGEPEWFKNRSSAPESTANKTSEATEKKVLKIRRKLEVSKFSQVGAFSIQWEMKRLGLEPLPTWTIDRILKRHNVVREKQRYKPSGVAYPDVRNIFSDSIQQADLVGPRYIRNDGRFYSMNIVDLETHMAAVNPCRTKGDENVARGLLHAWKTIGKPDYLQLDNELSFRGSNRYPRSLGLVLRMCLSLGVHVIFIPIAEPWRNGVIERFQQIFDKTFYRKQFFTSYQQLRREAGKFERFRNRNHRTSSLKGQTPIEHVKHSGIHINKLDHSVSLKNIDLTLTDGCIHFIRFIRSDLKLVISSERFSMPKSVKYEYVIATINTEDHLLQVKFDNHLIESFEYRIPVNYRRY